MNVRLSGAALALAGVLAIAPARAHELQDCRATLVLRDDTHVAVTIYVAYADALHAVLAPQRPTAEFLMAFSAMNPDLLQKELTRAQAAFQAGIRLTMPSGAPLTLANWTWPSAKQVQAMMQQRLMQATVDPAGHAHDEPAEIRLDAVSTEKISELRAQFPDAFQRVLVVSYRPNQVWVDPKGASPPIRFRPQ